MKLYAVVINEENITTLKNWVSPDLLIDPEDPELGRKALFKISDEESEEGYEDVSTIANWDRFRSRIATTAHVDYKFIRNEIKLLVIAKTWPALTDEEKEIAARWFVVDRDQRLEVLTTIEQIEIGKNHHRNSIASRQSRFDRAAMEIFNRLDAAEYKTILSEVLITNLVNSFIEFGHEGTDEGDPAEGIMDYIEGRGGFTGIGFKDKDYTPTGHDNMTDFAARIIEILKIGI